MNVLNAEIKPCEMGYQLILTTDTPIAEVSKVAEDIKNGKTEVYLDFPHNLSTSRQKSFLWAKISLLADSIGASKEEVYEIMLKRYGQSEYLVVSPFALSEIRKIYRLIEIVREDEEIEVKAYKGIEYMDRRELSILIDGVLSEL